MSPLKSDFCTSSVFFSWVQRGFFNLLSFYFTSLVSHKRPNLKHLVSVSVLLLEVVLVFLSPRLQFFSMLWPLPVLATGIHWQLLFQVFCTPFSLTKKLLIYLLLPYTWRIPSRFLFLPLAPFLLTLQRFSSSLFPLLLPECLLMLTCHSTSCVLPASVP